MRHFVKFFLFVLVFSVCAESQTFLNIKKVNGGAEYASLTQVQKLTFNEDGRVLNLHLLSGNVVSDTLHTIQSIFFDTTGHGGLVGIAQELGGKALTYNLSQNYPNPFNPTTTINYSVPNSGLVNLKVYDVLGNLVTTLVSEIKPAGQYSCMFKANNLASGIYFYKLSVGQITLSKKMILIK